MGLFHGTWWCRASAALRFRRNGIPKRDPGSRGAEHRSNGTAKGGGAEHRFNADRPLNILPPPSSPSP